mmetsp:Transcript_23845/g.55315  ORF Transcript_23845/g.55315 Transcript_23845/m.55315 type:complete len:245 (-) Transcript_23845:4292-5026(-)
MWKSAVAGVASATNRLRSPRLPSHTCRSKTRLSSSGSSGSRMTTYCADEAALADLASGWSSGSCATAPTDVAVMVTLALTVAERLSESMQKPAAAHAPCTGAGTKRVTTSPAEPDFLHARETPLVLNLAESEICALADKSPGTAVMVIDSPADTAKPNVSGLSVATSTELGEPSVSTTIPSVRSASRVNDVSRALCDEVLVTSTALTRAAWSGTSAVCVAVAVYSVEYRPSQSLMRMEPEKGVT